MPGSRTHAPAAEHAVVSRRPLDAQATMLMLVFCFGLGLQQVAIKAIAADIAPLAQIALRSAIAAVLVAMVAMGRGIRLADWRLALGPGVLVGLGFTSEFTFVALGLEYTTASHMVVFLYTAPIFAALGLHWLVPGEQLQMRHWAGIAVAFAGMTVAMAPDPVIAGPDARSLLIGDVLGLLAGLSWAATTVVLRRSRLADAPPVQILFYQLTTAALALLPVAFFAGDLTAVRWTPLAISSLVFQTGVVSFAALLLWFALLRRYLASRLGVFSFITPLFGVACGALLLDETLRLNFLFGGVAIILGIIQVSRPSISRLPVTSNLVILHT